MCILMLFQAETGRAGQEEETRRGGGVTEDESQAEGGGETEIKTTRICTLAF